MARRLLLHEKLTRNHESLELLDGTDGYRCPVCEEDFFDEGPCDHVVTTFSYSDPDEGGWWCLGDITAFAALPGAVRGLLEQLPESDLVADRSPASSLRRVRSARLRRLLEASLLAGDFDRRAADAYLGDILRRSP